MKKYNVIGLMSGSSLDGLDIAFIEFVEENGNWRYTIKKAETVAYPTKWKLRLTNLVLQNAITYLKTNTFFGHYIGGLVKEFLQENNLTDEVDFVASHGQTIFHQPDNRVTSQIGDGASIASVSGKIVVSDFRSTDIALGGQGAPMVPIGEKYLFPDYRLFLNLGGIANISVKLGEKFIGYDICACNLVLNKLAGELNKEYDDDGNIARTGTINKELMRELNASWYYEKTYPKSLSGGWVSKVMLPVVSRFKLPIEDKMRTVVEHIVNQIARDIEKINEREQLNLSMNDKILVSGGGAFNKFLMERLREVLNIEIIIPDEDTIKFKEALIIGFAGVLRVRREVNMLSSVTGAEKDSVGGCIYIGHARQKELSFDLL